ALVSDRVGAYPAGAGRNGGQHLRCRAPARHASTFAPAQARKAPATRGLGVGQSVATLNEPLRRWLACGEGGGDNPPLPCLFMPLRQRCASFAAVVATTPGSSLPCPNIRNLLSFSIASRCVAAHARSCPT